MTQQSKLSEALAATLLRFKEIDRDSIEALCKRAATLEHQVAEVHSNGTMTKSHNQLQWALRELLAQTRDLNDQDGDSHYAYQEQSEALKSAIAVADALVGEKATEQYPIADEPLNRRIQELEVQLAAAEKAKGQVFIAEAFLSEKSIAELNVKDSAGAVRVSIAATEPDLPQPLSYDAAMSIAQNGTDILGFMRGANWMLDQVKGKHKHTQISEGHSGGKVDSGLTYVMGQNYYSTKDLSLKWSENALRKLMEDVLADRESELVKEIINTEMLPGGRIHKALIGR